MAQVSDVSLANQGFSSFRTELNNILSALNSAHVGSSAPASAVAGTIWVDNSVTNKLTIKINDGTDNLELFTIDTTTNAINIASSITEVWETKTSAFTAEAGKNYFVDTSGGAVTATLPSSASAKDTVRFLDVAGTFDTNNLTVARNSHKIQADASDLTVATERAGFELIYYDATQGWLLRDK